DRRVVRPRAHLKGHQRRPRRLLPAARQHDGGSQVGRRGPREPHALAGRQRPADLLDAAPAQRAALRDGRPRRGHDLCAHRRHRGRVRRGPARARHAHPVHELQHGRVRPVLDPAHPVAGRPHPEPHHHAHPPPGDVLGPVGEECPRARDRRRGGAARRPCRGRTGEGRCHAMKVRSLILSLLTLVVLGSPWPAAAQTPVKVGWCAKTVSSAAAPFAIAMKMGWFKKEGLAVELIPLAGSADCTKTVATKEILLALPSVEPLAAARAQGVKAKICYPAYQGNIYGIAVPADSPVQKIADLKGKTIGVISMGSAGVPVAKALVATAGLNPESDVTIVVAGEGAQTAAMVRSKQVDALSQYDTQYAMVENAGVKLRLLDTKEIDRYPANGFLALDETLKSRRDDAVAVAKGYAMGTVFAIANPEAAVKILYEVFPQTKPTGKDEATALRDDVKVLNARIVNWKLDKAGVKRWGENSEANYAAYADFMLKYGIIKDKISAKDLITNDLIDAINRFDASKVAAEAKAYK